MTDLRARELERRAQAGDPEAKRGLLRSRLRDGSLEPKKLDLLAILGDEDARAIIERNCMGQSLTWSQADDYFPGFIVDLAHSHHYWDTVLKVRKTQCPEVHADPLRHVRMNDLVSRRDLDCDLCQGRGFIEMHDGIDSEARDSLLFRAALAAAHTCQGDRMQEWEGQGNVIHTILVASEAWLAENDDSIKSMLSRRICALTHGIEAHYQRINPLQANLHGVLPQWARFHRFFVPENLYHEQLNPEALWTDIALTLLRSAFRARFALENMDWEAILRRSILISLRPWLLA